MVVVSVQGLPPKTPLASVELKVTVPVGVVLVPISASLTVAVQVARTPTVSASQPTVVEVARLVTVTDVLPLLGACLRSPL